MSILAWRPQLDKLIRLRFGLPYVRRADRARDQAEWIDAVVDYRRGLEWMPWREDLKIQIGNCLKEFGEFTGAVRAYRSVASGPSLPEAHKQITDAEQRAGASMLPFATSERPDKPARQADDRLLAISDRMLPHRIEIASPSPRDYLGTLGGGGGLPHRLRGLGLATIKLDQVGAMVLKRDGAPEPLLAGVIAVRGRIAALTPHTVAELQIGDDDDPVLRQPVVLTAINGRGPLRMYVFNAWIDAAALAPGRYWLRVACGSLPPSGLFVTVGRVAEAKAFASSDAFVSVPDRAEDIDAAVLRIPPQIRAGARGLCDRQVRSVLLLRVDQLGDVSATLPAIARLRDLMPDARFHMLAQAGVRHVIEASGLVDEIFTIELAYDAARERRGLAVAEEARLRALFASHSFDLAIDLSPGDESRPLLLLSKATYLIGFNPDRFDFLDFGIGVRSRDKVNRLNKISHAATVMMLVEALAIASAPARHGVARQAPPVGLAGLRLTPRGYVAIHMGARHEINRWPAEKFADLCRMLLAETRYDLVVFGDVASHLTAEEAGSRLRQLDLLEPDVFDSVISQAIAFVGNDSGPKHLATVRGIPTVSVHIGRLNWNEWGQDGSGAIVSRRVPCTGCGLNDIALCGRDAVCLRTIEADRVLAALQPYL